MKALITGSGGLIGSACARVLGREGWEVVGIDSDVYAHGLYVIREAMAIDQSLHSVFGASKLAADVLCQEFGRYFQMPIGIFRGGCLTGPQHAAVELHGYLAYIVLCAVTGRPYTIFGYKGKQVRDQIHASDVAHVFLHSFRTPRCGEVYNLGGGRQNSLSIL